MASASPNSTVTEHAQAVPQPTEPVGKPGAPMRMLAPPGLLRCLIYSWNDSRAEGLQSAAENEAWDAIVCNNAGKFIKHLFRMKVPLTIVDLPEPNQVNYQKMREASAKVCDISDSLLILCGNSEDSSEEIWARGLGAWSYLPQVTNPRKINWVFEEARKAVARTASSGLEHQSTSNSIQMLMASMPPPTQESPPQSGESMARGGDRITPLTHSRISTDAQQKRKRT